MKNKELEFIEIQKENKNANLKLEKIEMNKSDDNSIVEIKSNNKKLLNDNEK